MRIHGLPHPTHSWRGCWQGRAWPPGRSPRRAPQFYAVSREGDAVVMTDLRMGQTPWFVFAVVIGEHDGDGVSAVPTRQVPSQRPPATVLPWLWARIWDEEK